ncbi:MAG: hypothetical protein CM15mP22_2850 [Gammaproteobacteria bacterium]|nr:MAG: hypothetical protein CM15mP22_2850 [Gammaproteobacteria bacterium]
MNSTDFLGRQFSAGRLGEWNLESVVKDIMPDGSYEFKKIINPETTEQVDCAVYSPRAPNNPY